MSQRLEALTTRIEAMEIASGTIIDNSAVLNGQAENFLEKYDLSMRRSRKDPLREAAFWLGASACGLYIVMLASIYIIQMIREKPLPKNAVLPIISGVIMATAGGFLKGEAKGVGSIEGQIGERQIPRASARSTFNFSITGSLVGFVIGGLLTLLIQWIS